MHRTILNSVAVFPGIFSLEINHSPDNECYDYRTSKEEKGEWIIEAAAVVHRIFQSVLAGETVAGIAKALRTEKIPIPSEHWKRP